MSKLVKAPLVIAKREDGSDVYVYRGAPLPDGLAKGEAKRLEEFLEDAPDAGSGDDGAAKVATVDDILKDVGDDKAKAAEALKTEEARGDDARSTLVKKLQAIAADGS